MLVTDLAQLPEVKVLSTSQLFQILKDLNKLDERITSLDVIQEVAQKADSETVILGSYMKAGDNIRINIELQNPSDGSILTTEKVEGVGEASLFSMVDELTRRIGGNLVAPADSEFIVRPLAELTTQSIEAYRYWNESYNMITRGQSRQALVFLEKALEEDPNFTEALISVAIMHSNLGHDKKASEYTARAFEHIDRAKPATRHRLEAWTYMRKEETYGEAIEACRRILELNPEDRPVRHWLARRLFRLERLDEAIEHWEWMRERKHPGVAIYSSLASAYALRGQPEKSVEVSQEYIERFPDRPAGYRGLALALIGVGELDEALDAILKEEALGPGSLRFPWEWWRIAILREEWEEADAASREKEAWRPLAFVRLYHGESERALELLGRDENADEDPSAVASNEAALVLLARGDFAQALEKSRAAQSIEPGHTPEWEGIVLESLALANLGRIEEARQAAEKLLARTASMPTEKEKRRHHHLLGDLALIEGDTDTAVRELEKAFSMLLPGHSEHRVLIGYSLASAYLASGDHDKAAQWFQEFADSGYRARLFSHPICPQLLLPRQDPRRPR